MHPVGDASSEIGYPLDDGSRYEESDALGPSAQAIDDRCAAAAHGDGGLAARERHHPDTEENEGETESSQTRKLGTSLRQDRLRQHLDHAAADLERSLGSPEELERRVGHCRPCVRSRCEVERRARTRYDGVV